MMMLPAAAQETYDNAPIAQQDLNGTARYVGMGGAMEALGADISTISSNPAGLGLFRKSYIGGSFGFVSQSDVESFKGGNVTNASFDQAGFVYAMRTSKRNFLNFGFNYHKSNNFDQILKVSNRLNGASQSKLSYIKGTEGVFDIGTNGSGEFVGNNDAFNQVDYLYYNALLHDGKADDGTENFVYNNANAFNFGRSNTGYIGEYDFNISGNSNNRFYWGITFGLHDVNYKGESAYAEMLVDDANKELGTVGINDSRKITGTGFDVKAGVIFRPVETSPLRIGLYVNTPVWYDLTTTNYTTLQNNSSVGEYDKGKSAESYEFKFYTPWKFGGSLGYTVGNYLALGATYEYADYGTCDARINDGGYTDYWGDWIDTSTRDEAMKQNIESSLKGVSTFKVGAEFKATPEFAVRLGYNYISPLYNKDGFKDGSLNSPGVYYSSSTDFTNWKSTNRITAGVGYTYKGWAFDIAYQYSQTNGDFYPFMNYYDAGDLTNVAEATKVSNKRNQVLFSLSYRF